MSRSSGPHPLTQNPLKTALRAGKVQIGCGIQHLRSQDVLRVLGAAGIQWGFVDAEHGSLGQEALQDICRYAPHAGITPVVRVADITYGLVARALDCGGQGIIFPRIEDPAVLETAVSWTKFPPAGKRGFGLAPINFDFELGSIPEMIEVANREGLVVLQIETKRALEARDELLSVPHIDAVLIGPADLSISLGVPGEFSHSSMSEAIEKIIESCHARGVIPGGHFRNEKLAAHWKQQGILLLSCNNETTMLYERARAVVESLA